MLDITAILYGDVLWDPTAEYAKTCSWRAGAYLAEMMKNNLFQEWERVFVAMKSNEIVGFCTISEKDELSNEYDFTPFVGFVFVDERNRGNRISEKLIDCASDYAKRLGYEKIYIMSGEKGLYEKYGFVLMGEYKTIYGWTDQLFVKKIG